MDLVFGPNIEEILKSADIDIPDFEVSDNFNIRSRTKRYIVLTEYDKEKDIHDLSVWENDEKEKSGNSTLKLWLYDIQTKDQAIKFHFGILSYIAQNNNLHINQNKHAER